MKLPRYLSRARDLAARLWPDDGQPIERRESRCKNSTISRKASQLAAQVQRHLQASAWAEAPRPFNEIIRSVQVSAEADGHTLSVTVAIDPSSTASADAIHAGRPRLLRYIRQEVARAITRRRLPQLKLQIVPDEGPQP